MVATLSLSNPVDILRAAVVAAVMAPSSHNTQPWRFRICGATLDLFADPTRQLKVIDGARRQQIQSCGCALYNARIAVRAMGYTDEVTTMLVDHDEPDHLATLHLGAPHAVTQRDRDLMSVIGKRHTNRRSFLARPIAQSITDALAHTAEAEGVRFVRLDPSQKAAVAELIEQADHAQFSDPAFRAELAEWLRPFGSLKRDGIPFVEKEYGSGLPFTLVRALRSPGLGDAFGKTEEALVVGAPAVLALGTERDDPPAWLACGEALQAILLEATTLGLSASFLNQVLELPTMRAKLADIAPGLGYPQMVIRLGVPDRPIEHAAPRRPIDDVLEVVSRR